MSATFTDWLAMLDWLPLGSFHDMAFNSVGAISQSNPKKNLHAVIVPIDSSVSLVVTTGTGGTNPTVTFLQPRHAEKFLKDLSS